MFCGKDVDSTILMPSGNKLTIGRLYMSVGAIERITTGLTKSIQVPKLPLVS